MINRMLELFFGETKYESLKKDKLEKIDYLTEEGKNEIRYQNEIFNNLDKKSFWFFALIASTQIYIGKTYFLGENNFSDNQKYISTGADILLYTILGIGVLILISLIFNVSAKDFKTGGAMDKQFYKYINNITSYHLKEDTLKAIIKSIENNNKILNGKGAFFRYIIWGIYLYYFSVFCYILILRIGVI